MAPLGLAIGEDSCIEMETNWLVSSGKSMNWIGQRGILTITLINGEEMVEAKVACAINPTWMDADGNIVPEKDSL